MYFRQPCHPRGQESWDGIRVSTQLQLSPKTLTSSTRYFKPEFKLAFDFFEESPFIFTPLIRIPNVSSHYGNANESFLEQFYHSSRSATIGRSHFPRKGRNDLNKYVCGFQRGLCREALSLHGQIKAHSGVNMSV